MTTTLSEFLMARIAEDEATAQGWQVGSIVNPARALAECEAKRGIISEPFANERGDMDQWECVLEWLALPYADHPDYLPEWKP